MIADLADRTRRERYCVICVNLRSISSIRLIVADRRVRKKCDDAGADDRRDDLKREVIVIVRYLLVLATFAEIIEESNGELKKE